MPSGRGIATRQSPRELPPETCDYLVFCSRMAGKHSATLLLYSANMASKVSRVSGQETNSHVWAGGSSSSEPRYLKSLPMLCSILFHALLDPLLTLIGMLLHSVLVSQELLHPVWIRDIGTLLYRRTCPHPLFPALEMWKRLNVDSCPTTCRNPSPVSDVGNGTFIADQVLGLGISEMLVEDAVETFGFILVAVDCCEKSARSVVWRRRLWTLFT